MPSTAVAPPKLDQVMVPTSVGSTSASGQVSLSVSVARTLEKPSTWTGVLSAPATSASLAMVTYSRSDSSCRLPDGCTRMVTLLIGCSGCDDASALTGLATK